MRFAAVFASVLSFGSLFVAAVPTPNPALMNGADVQARALDPVYAVANIARADEATIGKRKGGKGHNHKGGKGKGNGGGGGGGGGGGSNQQNGGGPEQ